MSAERICPTCDTEYPATERFCPKDGSALRAIGGGGDLVGSVIAERYHVTKKLGEGGMGQVYLAEHVKMGRKSAVKVMNPGLVEDVDAIGRFNREAANASRVHHPNVAAIYDFGETSNGMIFLAMEFIEGRSLTSLMAEEGPLSPERAAAITRQAAEGLQSAHDMGIVHRDLKPDNIMIAVDKNGGDLVKVVDFGIAKATAGAGNQKVTRTGFIVGTPEYMSPEQLSGDQVDGRSDIYSLALVTFNMLTGRLPFQSDASPAAMFMRLADEPMTLSEARPEVKWPADVQGVMQTALATQPPDRYDSAAAFGADLSVAVARMPKVGSSEALTRLSTQASMAKARAPLRRRLGPTRESRRLATGAAVAALVLVLAAVGAWQYRTAKPRAPAASAELAPQRVVVATFANRTGDPSLDPLGAMAADWIARALAGTGLVDVAGTQSDLAARDSAGASVAAQSVASLATLAKAGLVISGSYYRRGDSVAFEADFTDASAGKRLPTIKPVAAPASRPLDAVELLRQRVTGSLAALLDPRLAALSAVATRPPSMEAYGEYLKGDELRFSDAGDAALQHYARAAALDSAYVLPLLRLMNLYGNLQRDREADSIGRILQRRQDRLLPFERLYLDLQLARAHDDIPAEYTAAVAMARAAPKSQFAANSLALAAHRAGRLREADSIYSRLDPEAGELRGQADLCVFYVMTLHSLGAHDRVLEDGTRACRQFRGQGFAAVPGIFGLAALGREKELRILIEDVLRLPLGRNFSSPDRLAVYAVHELRAHGHPEAAERLAARVIAWHDSSRSDVGVHRPIARARALRAARAWDRLQSLADTLVKRQPRDIEALTYAGIARTMRGDRAGAARASAAIELAPPPVRRYSILGARAVIAAAAGDSAGAVALLIEASPPRGWRSDLYHSSGVYGLLHGYAPFEALLRPVP